MNRPIATTAHYRLAFIGMLLMISACASPDVDRSKPDFDETQYQADLHQCRNGSEGEFATRLIGGAFVGSMHGAAIGGWKGLCCGGGSAEGAALGALVGIGVGAVTGTIYHVVEENKKVRRCMRAAGYREPDQ